MPTVEPVNTQQILQMGSHVEKVQQTIQQLPSTTALQLEEERILMDEAKRTEVPESGDSQESEASNPEGKNRKGRLRHPPSQSEQSSQADESSSSMAIPEQSNQGKSIDVVA